jgi:hypothetical protein
MSVFLSHHISCSIKPFDDLESSQLNRKNGTVTNNFNGVYDRSRQGTEIRTVEDILKTNQPKLRSRGLFSTIDSFGKVTHEQKLNNIGSVQSFVEYTNQKFYNDLQEELLPEKFIENNQNVYYPFYMNSGLYKIERCTVEILQSYPGRFPESSIGFGTTRGKSYEQFSINTTCFLDEGEEFLGDTLSGSIVFEGWLAPVSNSIQCYFEQDPTITWVENLTITDQQMKNSLNSLTASCLETNLVINLNKRTSVVFDGWRKGS